MITYKRHRFLPGFSASSLAPLSKYSSQAESKSAWLNADRGKLHLIQGSSYKKPPRNSRADILTDLVLRGEYPGGEIPITLDGPDEPDALDADDVLQGFGQVVGVGFVE